MRQHDCQGHFGWVVACLLILRLSFTAGMWMTAAIGDEALAPIGEPIRRPAEDIKGALLSA
ncbi:UNVERIFIED_ORG: hypothetical protein J2W66_003487 [Agrobacterium larrymoorei]|nr:hypothetical protein [Agrobacterium larrymoorei]